MPAISTFYGIIVYMYSERGERHHVPHIHVNYQDEEAVISLDGEILEGGIPKAKKKLIDAWIEIHRDELTENWKLLSEGRRFFRIAPLK